MGDRITADRLRRAHDMPIGDVALRYGMALKRDGRDFVALCPFHKEKTPSFRLSPDRKSAHCFGCGWHGDVIQFVMELESVNFPDAVTRLVPDDDGRVSPATVAKPVEPSEGIRIEKRRFDAERTRQALRTFNEAQPLAGTVGATYINNRGVHLPDWPADIRLHQSCPRKVDGVLEHHPAIVALLRDIRTNEPRAVQRIFLKADASDRLRDVMGKATLGPATGAVIKLTPDEDVTLGLGICEGVEKALALMAINWSPIWVTCGTSGMAAFPALTGIEALTIFANSDEPGQKAALTCAQRWSDAGKQVAIFTPKIAGTDWSDALKGTAA